MLTAPATVEAALFRDVLEQPADDAPRLILADWWSEHGQEERAELVRVQCELARPAEVVGGWNVFRPLLHDRERELLSAAAFWAWFDDYAHGWAKAWPGSPAASPPQQEGDALALEVGYFNHRMTARYPHWTFRVRRGFVERLELPAVAFMDHAAALFTAHPIIEVRLTDKEPWAPPGSSLWSWHRLNGDPAEPAVIPATLWSFLGRGVAWSHDCSRGYPSAADAHTALSAACVRYGRDLAGLPPLPG